MAGNLPCGMKDRETLTGVLSAPIVRAKLYIAVKYLGCDSARSGRRTDLLVPLLPAPSIHIHFSSYWVPTNTTIQITNEVATRSAACLLPL
ncbi:hypothetical protein EC957_000922 [Mortierella hygrophila]|uniref:Uncharacterized protein n=1 Tax=Mortierella hygrophila TaxID=979708 RepID=A0A9P6F714_9FUNG|nr:hypothetical protein EC957_000922 [Mortierella hygrophila]